MISNRVEFTKALVLLLMKMRNEGESPIVDYVKRSDEEQMHLYQEGKSQCDGVNKISKHQIGRAADIYFVDKGKLCEPIRGHDYWHEVWQSLGGAAMISWDKGHYE